MHYIDANIFLGALTGDDEKVLQACQALFIKVSKNQIVVAAHDGTIAEVIYILSSKNLNYKLTRVQIRDRLHPMIELKGLRLQSKPAMRIALDIYAKYNIDFADTLTVGYMLADNVAIVSIN